MKSGEFDFKDFEGYKIHVYKWMPDNEKPKAIVQIVHGMAEHAKRYERFAEFLTKNNIGVYADDHRGHGKSALSINEQGYLGEKDGLDCILKDEKELTDIIKKENPGVPVIIFGHSMGSFVTQGYIANYGNEVKGAIISGSAGAQGPIIYVGMLISFIQMLIMGKKKPSKLMDTLSFGAFNNKFKPNKTPFDWLSRDENEVKKYIDDPYCGKVFPASFFFYLMKFLAKLHKPWYIKNVPLDLPIYIFSGDSDPVGGFGKLVNKLYNMYKKLGVKNLSIKLYKDGRHEMLNEINRDEVMNDILNWIQKIL